MSRTRREFLKTAAATGTLAAVPSMPASARPAHKALAQRIAALFAALPDDKGFKILAPGVNGNETFVAELDADRTLFCASAIKSYVLCEALRQADSPDVVKRLGQNALVLDSTVWSFGSPTFDPPNLIGIVSERTAMEAMITRSDNTATDMIFKVAGADNVRNLVAAIGLTNTRVPDSTRALTGYLFGAPNYLELTWEQMQELVQGPQVQPFLNDVETLASSAADFVSYYSRALQGELFQHRETLDEFRRILTLCDFIYLVPLPLGASVYTKSGKADAPGFHARALAGGMFFGEQWVYFAFVINWYEKDAEDPETVARFFAAINESLTLVKASLSKN
jgi:beta-lactamase class A